uniref:Acylphosphatase-like domain-containing protein n=1 Tax=Ditylum brightwellii TaxID=49249 RepID=A0A6V2PX56_9STRA|mmetsp:Transcript_38149/g.56028  ORF Transcript_38149/g.56028 Transcript_38149/m.56028 type:complete len:112 (-) Transcript_38149:858-1193(-)
MNSIHAMLAAIATMLLITAVPSTSAFTVLEPTALRTASTMASIPESSMNKAFARQQTTFGDRSRIYRMADGDADVGVADPNEMVARRIVVTGDVQGGYYRSCVANEVRHMT